MEAGCTQSPTSILDQALFNSVHAPTHKVIWFSTISSRHDLNYISFQLKFLFLALKKPPQVFNHSIITWMIYLQQRSVLFNVELCTKKQRHCYIGTMMRVTSDLHGIQRVKITRYMSLVRISMTRECTRDEGWRQRRVWAHVSFVCSMQAALRQTNDCLFFSMRSYRVSLAHAFLTHALLHSPSFSIFWAWLAFPFPSHCCSSLLYQVTFACSFFLSFVHAHRVSYSLPRFRRSSSLSLQTMKKPARVHLFTLRPLDYLPIRETKKA